jgi:pimeloyl-ACP methyl ester carboxylesterase
MTEPGPLAPKPRGLYGWTKRIATTLLGLVALGLLTGVSYQALAGSVDEGNYPPPGRMIDVGGHRLHLYCTGEGSPTVVLEAGLGLGMVTWRKVQPPVSRLTRVCSYDRAGYGWSEGGPLPRTSSRVSEELRTLLQKSGERGPWVLVGHSLGGLYVRYFAATYPADVSGMVLVDSSHEDQSQPPRWFRIAVKAATLSGITRLLVRFEDPATQAVYHSNRSASAALSELAAITESQVEVRGAHLSLGNKPLLVLTAGENNQDAEWRRLQTDLLSRSTNSRQIVVEQSGHNIQDEQPDAIVSAVRRILVVIPHE